MRILSFIAATSYPQRCPLTLRVDKGYADIMVILQNINFMGKKLKDPPKIGYLKKILMIL